MLTTSLIKSFEHNHKRLSIFGTVDEPLFLAKQVGAFLDIKNIRDTLISIPDEWKVVGETDTLGGKQNMVYIKEPALYKIAFRSNKKEADDFTNWVASEVLPSIRKTGQYTPPERKQIKTRTVFKIESEKDLHYKTINFIKNLPYDLLINATLGELQDTPSKRIDAFNKGYIKGTPDVIIMNPTSKYNGLAIEFKSPQGTGATSEYQRDMLDKYKVIGYKVICSNDYDSIVMALYDYVQDLRVVCKYCSRKFRNNNSLGNHKKYFHKIVQE